MKLIFATALVGLVLTTHVIAQDCIPNVTIARYATDTSHINELDSFSRRQGTWIFSGALCRQWGWPNSSGDVFDSCEVCAIAHFKDGLIIDTSFLFNRKGELITINIPFESENQPTEVGYYPSGNKRYERYSTSYNQQNI